MINVYSLVLTIFKYLYIVVVFFRSKKILFFLLLLWNTYTRKWEFFWFNVIDAVIYGIARCNQQ